MSRVAFDPPRPNEVRSVTPYNTAMQAIVTQSSNVEPENVAQEGLTLAEFEHRPRVQLFKVSETTRASTALTATSWATFAYSGTTFEYTTNFTLTTSQKLILRWRAFFSARPGQPAYASAAQHEMRLALKLTTAAETTHCLQEFGGSVQQGWVGGQYLVTTAGEYDYTRLEYQLASGSAYPHYSVFYGILITGD